MNPQNPLLEEFVSSIFPREYRDHLLQNSWLTWELTQSRLSGLLLAMSVGLSVRFQRELKI